VNTEKNPIEGGGNMKRSILVATLFLVMHGWSLGVSTVHSQSYPNRHIQFIIPNVPGSTLDITARAFTEELGKLLGTQIIPINKPGAGTVAGSEALARSKKDGYTIGYITNAAMVYARILNPETIHFDPDKDIEPLGLHVQLPLAIGVQANSPWKTFNELIDYAKKNPGKLRVNTIGIGTAAHFDLEIIQSLTGAQFTHIPYKGGESVTTALLGGHIEMTCDVISKLVPHIESGKLRCLLLSTKMAELPDVPTLTDLGYKQGMVSTWFAVYAPSGLPEEIKKVLLPAVEKAVKAPDVKGRIEKMHFVVDYKSPMELGKMVTGEYEMAVGIAKKVGLTK
jgi:tripartite-type tricarboxylate transporter receptor subunit TctC